jgi:drug/metabolite transporter superfamily protein YnfA
MQKDKFDRIISFLLGASSAIVILGSIITFKSFQVFGIPLAIFSSIIFIITSLFMILALDAFSINRQRLQEAKKQTKLLEKLWENNTQN